MTKIDEILNKYRDITRWPEYPEISESEYIQAMQEYAEYYAQKCLEIASESAYIIKLSDYCREDGSHQAVSTNSITSIKFPPHD